MNAGGSGLREDKPAPWWRGGWIWLAAAVLAAEVGVVRLLSAKEGPPPASTRKPLPRYRMVPETEGGASEADAMAWSLLWSPAVLLMPSEHDFSGSAWLNGSTAEVSLESFVARGQPLPFQPVRGSAVGADDFPRLDPGTMGRWHVPAGIGPLPAMAPVALPEKGSVRILEGCAGWALASVPPLEPLPGGLLVPGAVVRVVIDEDGTAASPPYIWESSGEPAADEAALNVVRGLRWVPHGAARARGGPSEGSRGMIAVQWPAPRASGSGGETKAP